MIQLLRTIGIYALTAMVLQSCTVHATTYYVATNGNNSNPGTEARPWQTVTHAVSRMAAGDTTYVKGGTYKEGVIRFGRSGTQAAPIKLLNAPGEFPVIDCIDKTKFHRVLLEHVSGARYPMGWITIEGFEIRNCYDGIKFHNAYDLTIRRNWIHHNAKQGILGNGNRVLIDRNRINHNGRFAECAVTPSVCGLDHGIYGSGGAFTIINNLIYDNLAFGVQVAGAYTYDPAKHAGPEYALCENWIIANNTIAYQVNGSGIVLWGSSLTNMRVENNIFYENGVNRPSSAAQGINFVSATGNRSITLRNNLAYASGTGGTTFLGGLAIEDIHYTQSDNIVNVRNPGFVNAPATLPTPPDFKLTANSPAIDVGLTLAITGTAFDDTIRPQGHAYDVGAYEYDPDRDNRELRP